MSSRLKTFQNLLMQSQKVALDIKDKLMDMCGPTNSNRLKEHKATTVSFAHGKRDSSNTIQIVVEAI